MPEQLRVLGRGCRHSRSILASAGFQPALQPCADFNADGKPDLTTAHPTTNNVSVLLNTTVTNRAPATTADAYSTAEDTP
jgi:hypothetical protein